MFAALGLPLFPRRPRHGVLVPRLGLPVQAPVGGAYLLAEAFDDDPFLVLAWRGRAEDDLLDALRGLADDDEAADPLPSTRCRFDRPDDRLLRSRRLPRPPAVPAPVAPAPPPDLLLRALDPPPVKVRHIPLLDILRPVYRDLADS